MLIWKSIAIKSGNEERVFGLEEAFGRVHDPGSLPIDFAGSWTSGQIPKLIHLRLLKALDYDYGHRTYLLNVSASVRSLLLFYNYTAF